MSKYRNALQQTHSLAINKVNTLALGPYKNENDKENTLSTTTSLTINKSINLKKVNKLRLSFDRVILILSRIHNACNLRFQTFCLAIELYKKYMSTMENPEDQNVTSGYLILACIFLSMKYNQIYHARLKQILQYIPPDLMAPKFKIVDYMQYEVFIFRKIGSSMNFKTAKLILDELLRNNIPEAFFYAYYLLEIAYNDKKITQQFTTEEICKVIYLTMLPLHKREKKMRQFKGDKVEDFIDCSKQLISRKCKHTQEESSIYSKYCREKYLKVALQPYIQVKVQTL